MVSTEKEFFRRSFSPERCGLHSDNLTSLDSYVYDISSHYNIFTATISLMTLKCEGYLIVMLSQPQVQLN